MVTGDVLQALELLGVPVIIPQGVDTIPLSVGLRMRPAADTGAPSRLFGLGRLPRQDHAVSAAACRLHPEH